MNYDTMKFLCITLFLWIGFPLSATAAEAEAGSGKRAQLAVGARTTQWLDISAKGAPQATCCPFPARKQDPATSAISTVSANPIPDQLLAPMPASGAKK